jgi:hypothetical protein
MEVLTERKNQVVSKLLSRVSQPRVMSGGFPRSATLIFSAGCAEGRPLPVLIGPSPNEGLIHLLGHGALLNDRDLSKHLQFPLYPA